LNNFKVCRRTNTVNTKIKRCSCKDYQTPKSSNS